MITLRQTQTQEEVKNFSDTFHNLTVKTADGMSLLLGSDGTTGSPETRL